MTGHVFGGGWSSGGSGDVHQKYVHKDRFSMKVMTGSIDILGEAYREMLKGLL